MGIQRKSMIMLISGLKGLIEDVKSISLKVRSLQEKNITNVDKQNVYIYIYTPNCNDVVIKK